MRPKRGISRVTIGVNIAALIVVIGSALAILYLYEIGPSMGAASNTPASMVPKISAQNQNPLGFSLMNCGSNLECFVNASKNCTPSEINDTTSVGINGINGTVVSYERINGLNNSRCSFYIETMSINLSYPPGTSQTTQMELNAILPSLEGQSGTCLFNTTELTPLLEKWQSGNISSSDFNSSDCSGSYFSTIGTFT